MSLRDKLVAYRKRVADGKPAFCVFDNKTIDAIVDAKPASVAAFGRVAGIGPTKREKYGDDVVRICTEHGGGAVGKPLGPSKPRKRAAQPSNTGGGALEGFFAPRGKKAKYDERAMRLAGLRFGVPCITTLAAAKAGALEASKGEPDAGRMERK